MSTSLAEPRGSLFALHTAGLGVLRYGLVFILVLWGAFKFLAFEAEAIRPFVENSPLLSWLPRVLGMRNASAILGVVEVSAGLGIALRRWQPRISGLASLAAAAMFVVTLSFLVTTPGVLEPTSETGGFLMKDLFLLGAALFTGAESLLAAEGRTA